MPLPHLIGICGHPKSGKSLVQTILLEQFDVQTKDDGLPLRQIAMKHFGAKEHDVFTQEGKASLAYWPNGEPIMDEIRGNHMTWRQVLGRIGHQLEELFGPYIMPMMTCATLPTTGSFSFGSVRKTQGVFYRRNGGIVIEVRNPLAQPSGNDFDLYDETLVDYVIENDALARGLSHSAALKDLENKVCALVASINNGSVDQAA